RTPLPSPPRPSPVLDTTRRPHLPETQTTRKKNGNRSSRFSTYPESAREGRRVNARHIFHYAYHLAAVTELVVVPDIEHHAVVAADGSLGIDHTGMTRTDEISGYNFLRVDEVDLLLQLRMHRHLTQVLVDLLATGGLLQVQVENSHRDVRRRHADGIAGQLALEHRQRLGGGSGSTGLGDDHVQRRAAATTTALVEVVDQVLVVGIGVHGFNVTVDDAVLVVDRLEHRHDGVGGAGSGRDDLVIGGDVAMVDAMHDVLQFALARRRQHDARNARALEVLAEAFGV